MSESHSAPMGATKHDLYYAPNFHKLLFRDILLLFAYFLEEEKNQDRQTNIHIFKILQKILQL